MKKLIILVAVALAVGLALPASSEAASPSEVKKLTASDAQVNDRFGVSVAVNGRIAFAGADGTWVTLASMPTARLYLAAAASTDGRIYAIGGWGSAGYLDTVEVYTPSANTWAAAASMPTGREQLAAVTGPDGRIYAIGGGNTDGWCLGTVEAYTASTNTWVTLASMPTPRASLAAAVGTDGRIYAISGIECIPGFGAVYSDKVEAYTPSTNSWSTVSPISTARRYVAAATGSDERLYAIGGWNNNYLGSVEAYTPSTNSWSTVASLPTPRSHLAAASGSDGRLYAIGGYNGAWLSTAEAYTPSTNAWEAVAGMPTARSALAAAASPDGRIYATGGVASGMALDTLEVYTPPAVGGVGGIAELPELDGAPLEAAGSSGPGAGVLAGMAVAFAAGALALGGGAWYMRRRWVR